MVDYPYWGRDAEMLQDKAVRANKPSLINRKHNPLPSFIVLHGRHMWFDTYYCNLEEILEEAVYIPVKRQIFGINFVVVVSFLGFVYPYKPLVAHFPAIHHYYYRAIQSVLHIRHKSTIRWLSQQLRSY